MGLIANRPLLLLWRSIAQLLDLDVRVTHLVTALYLSNMDIHHL
jgi:hypothetical protein